MLLYAAFCQSFATDGELLFPRTYRFNFTFLHRQTDSDLEGAGVGSGAAGGRRAGGCLSRHNGGGREGGQGSESELHCCMRTSDAIDAVTTKRLECNRQARLFGFS
jgi:hypothetical protein